MHERQHLSAPALLALCVAYLVSAVASATAQTAATFTESLGGTSLTDSLPFIISIGMTTLVVVAVRRRPAWLVVLAAHTVMLVGTATILLDSTHFVSQLSVSVVLVGAQIVAAALLIVAWRAEPNVTAVLAGVFVLPRVLNSAVMLEFLRSDRLFARTPLIVITLCLLFVGLLTAAVVRSGETGGPIATERGVARNVIVGNALLLSGMAVIVSQSDPYGGSATGLALVAWLIGFVILGVTLQNRKTTGPAFHVDLSLLIFCGVVVALSSWVSFGSNFLVGVQSFLGPAITAEVNALTGPGRAVSLALVLTAVPIVALVIRSGRRFLSVGAGAIAGAGLLWVFFVLADLEVGLADYVLVTILIEWGGLIVLGGTVAFVIHQIGGASIEFGLLVFLAIIPLIENMARQFPYEFIGTDLVMSDFQDLTDLRLFTLSSVIGLIWIAAWWALRPETRTDLGDDGPGAVDSDLQPASPGPTQE